MDPPVKLSSAQRALLHRIKEAREWYQGSDPDTRFRRDPFPPACVRMGRGGEPSTVEQLVHGCAALYIDLLKVKNDDPGWTLSSPNKFLFVSLCTEF